MMAGMEDFAFVKNAGRSYWARVIGSAAAELSAEPWLPGAAPAAGAGTLELGELVWGALSAGRTLAGVSESGGVWVQPPSSHAPHRTMVPLCYPEDETRCEAGVGLLFGAPARRLKPDQARAAVFGFFPVLSFVNETVSRARGGESGRCFESYCVTGPLLRAGFPAASDFLEIAHNAAASTAPVGSGLEGRVAAATDIAAFGPGDILFCPLVKSGALVKPGDHVQAALAGLRPVAINVGMRGSA